MKEILRLRIDPVKCTTDGAIERVIRCIDPGVSYSSLQCKTPLSLSHRLLCHNHISLLSRTVGFFTGAGKNDGIPRNFIAHIIASAVFTFFVCFQISHIDSQPSRSTRRNQTKQNICWNFTGRTKMCVCAKIQRRRRTVNCAARLRM